MGLRHLYRALALDQDFAPRFQALRQELRSTLGGPRGVPSLWALRERREPLAALYDRAVADVVDTFEGGHTEFRWQDPRFLPWLRSRLARPRSPADPAGSQGGLAQ